MRRFDTINLYILPGLDGTTRMLEAFIVEARAAGFGDIHAIAYPPDRPLGYGELETFVRAELPQEAPFVLLGESFSGPIAIAIAADPPPNLIGLVLSTTFARAPVPLLAPFAPLTRFAPTRALPTAVLSAVLWVAGVRPNSGGRCAPRWMKSHPQCSAPAPARRCASTYRSVSRASRCLH